MPLTAQSSRAPAKKKGTKKERKAAQEAPARSGSPVRSSKTKLSGRKFQTVALTISESASTAVINRLPPEAPPDDTTKFDQNRWLEEQLALTQQMERLYNDDGSGSAACPYLGGAAADDEDESEEAWREEPDVEEAHRGDGVASSASGRAPAIDISREGGAADSEDEDEEDDEDDEGEEESEAAEASGSAGTSKETTLRSSARTRRHATKIVPKRPMAAEAAVTAALQKAAAHSDLFGGGKLEGLEPFSPFCVGRQAVAFPDIEITLPAGRAESSMQHGLFDRGT